jgi:hypothetical protein
MTPYDMMLELNRQAGITPMFESTKFCKDLYAGCKNPLCTYAHSRPTARWTDEYAMEDVYFVRPKGSARLGIAANQALPISSTPGVGMDFTLVFDSDGNLIERAQPPSVTMSVLLKQEQKNQADWLKRLHILGEDKRYRLLHKMYTDAYKRQQAQFTSDTSSPPMDLSD